MHFPIEKLKIDRSFVTAIETDREDAAVVQAILSLAQALDIDVVAEGIETAGQSRLLERLGLQLRPGLPLRATPCGRRGVAGAGRHRLRPALYALRRRHFRSSGAVIRSSTDRLVRLLQMGT